MQGFRAYLIRVLRLSPPAWRKGLLLGACASLSLSLLVSPDLDAQGALMVHWLPEGAAPFLRLVSRSTAALAASAYSRLNGLPRCGCAASPAASMRL